MTETTDIAAIVASNPVAVLVDAKTYAEFLAHIRAETSAFVPDLSTVTSRGKISALAYKVTRTKTAIDAAGKKLNEEARANIGKVDEQRRKIRADLETIADSVRKPLTDWEQSEQTRVASCTAMIAKLEEIGNLKLNGANALFPDLFAAVEAIEIDTTYFGELAEQATRLKSGAIEKLNNAQAAHAKAEADKAELEILRKAESDRKAKEAEALAEAMRIAAAEKEKAAQAERDRLAEERVRAEERRASAEAIAKVEREKQALIEEAKRAEADREASRQRETADQAARDADETHRNAVINAAGEALITFGIGKTAAKKIVLAIAAGSVPHISMKF